MSRFAVNGKNGRMKTMQDIYARFADMVEELQQKGGEPDYRKI